MFDHLIGFSPEPSGVGDFISSVKASASQVLEAQVNTAQWLDELGVPSDEEIDKKQQQNAAREAFSSLAVVTDEDAAVKERLAKLKTPAAIQHLAGMLVAYDWEFVEQAKLGNVTEVALFTERVEVKKVDASEEEIEARLRERLGRYLRPIDVVDIEPVAAPEPEQITLDEEISAIAEVKAEAHA